MAGCGRVVEGTKEALNKGGELAGSAATEVIEGVATGVEDTWSVDVTLSEAVRAKGLSIGRTQVEADSAERNNTLIVYLIAGAAYTDTLQALATDEKGLEMGRCTAVISMASGDADHVLFRFQDRTDLERKCSVVIR